MQRRYLWLCAYVPFQAAFVGAVVLLPIFAIEIGGNVADIGIMKSTYNLTFMLAAVFWARLSDYYGKRKVFILFGLSSASLIFLLFAAARDVSEVIVFNALMGVLVTALTPSTSMLIIESSSRSEWDSKMSEYNTVIAIGSVLGTFSGVLLLNFIKLRTLFVIEAAFCFAGLVLAVLLVREPKITLERKAAPIISLSIIEKMRIMPTILLRIPHLFGVRRHAKMIRRSGIRNLPILYLSVFLLFLGSIPAISVTPVFLKEFGVPNSVIFLILSAPSIASILAFKISASVSEKLGFKRPVALGIFLRMLAAMILSLVSYLTYTLSNLDFYSLVGASVAALAFFGAGFSFVWNPSQTEVARLADPRHGSEAQGMFNSVVAAGTVAGALIGGFVAHTYGFTVTYLIGLLPMIAGILLLKLVHE